MTVLFVTGVNDRSIVAVTLDDAGRRETWEDSQRRMRHFDREVIPEVWPAIDEIIRRVKLDIYGIDCCIVRSLRNGRIYSISNLWSSTGWRSQEAAPAARRGGLCAAVWL